MNPIDSRVLYGIVGTLSPGRAVACALALVAVGGLVRQVLPLTRPAPLKVSTGTTMARAADASMLALMIVLLAIAAYNFVRFGLSYV